MRTKEEFYAQWPELFRDVSCGFYLPKGWSELVWQLCTDIEHELEGDFSDLKCEQVKEKFGGLRFYVSGPAGAHKINEEIRAIIDVAEVRSFRVCLTCGTDKGVTTGVTGGNIGWVSSQCDPCRAIPKHPRVKRTDA